jgi:hypothetical protein
MDRSLPHCLCRITRVQGPSAGLTFFLTTPVNIKVPATCNTCHTSNPGPGTEGVIDPGDSMDTAQPMPRPQKTNADFKPRAVGVDGIAFRNDGTKTRLGADR